MSTDALRAELRRLLDVDHAPADWDDVLRRAGERRPLRRRRVVLALVAAIVIVLVTGSALALSGRLGGLLRGTPVRDLSPLERFFLEDLPGKGATVELVATHGDRAFYVLRRRGGGVCYAVGRVGVRLTPAQAERQTRFGALGCTPRSLFPSRLVPVLDFSVYAGRFGTPAHLVRLEGFAADPARRVGVIGPGNRVFFSAPVTRTRIRAGPRPPDRCAGSSPSTPAGRRSTSRASHAAVAAGTATRRGRSRRPTLRSVPSARGTPCRRRVRRRAPGSRSAASTWSCGSQGSRRESSGCSPRAVGRSELDASSSFASLESRSSLVRVSTGASRQRSERGSIPRVGMWQPRSTAAP